MFVLTLKNTLGGDIGQLLWLWPVHRTSNLPLSCMKKKYFCFIFNSGLTVSFSAFINFSENMFGLRFDSEQFLKETGVGNERADVYSWYSKAFKSFPTFSSFPSTVRKVSASNNLPSPLKVTKSLYSCWVVPVLLQFWAEFYFILPHIREHPNTTLILINICFHDLLSLAVMSNKN